MFVESSEESATGGKSFKMESKLSRAEFKLFFGDLFGAADVLSPEMLRDDSCCKAASNDSGILGACAPANVIQGLEFQVSSFSVKKEYMPFSPTMPATLKKS